MKFSPYETFACTGYIIDKIGTEIQKEITIDKHGPAFQWTGSNNIGKSVINLVSNTAFNPTSFAHPIDIIVNKGRGEDESLGTVVDVRPFTKIDKIHGTQVTKTVDFELAKRRALLHGIWSTSDQFLLSNSLSPLTQIFASWISESICKRLDVDGLTQLKVANIAAWWFWCQCNKETDLNDNTRPRIYRSVADATRSSFETVEEDLDDIGYFDDMVSFCQEVKSRSDNPRLKHLDPASLIQLTAGGWIGTWSREIMSVSVEYPPYFAAVVYTAIHERGTRAAQFTKFVQRFLTRPEIKGFKTSIDQLSKTDDYGL